MPIRHTRHGGLPTTVIDKQASLQLGLVAQGIVQARAFDQGRGLDDRRHAPYSPGYARRKARRGEQVSPPNLTDTGRMRRAMRVLWAERRFTAIGIAGAAARYARHVHERRPFIGASPRDRVKIRRRAAPIIHAAIRRSIRP